MKKWWVFGHRVIHEPEFGIEIQSIGSVWWIRGIKHLLLLLICVTGYSLLLRYDKVVHKSNLFLLCLFPLALASLIRWDIFFLNYSSSSSFTSRYRFRCVFWGTLLFDSIMQHLVLHQIVKQCSGWFGSGSCGRRVELVLLLSVSIEVATEHLHDILFVSVRDRFSKRWLLLSLRFKSCRCCAGVASASSSSSGLGPMGCFRLRRLGH